jgi:uncharacterized membrane protein YphA (DoxX/SURF4 family)
MKRTLTWLLRPPIDGPAATLLIRLLAGGVFFSEGLLKLVYVNQGVGRFTKLGIPMPETMAHAIAALEIIGGLLIVSGLFTRAIAIPFIVEMIVAILTTKIALYLGTSPLPMPPAPPKDGIWAVLHETRSDWSQLLSCGFLMMVGPGKVSLDAWRARARAPIGDERQAVVAARFST